MHWLPPEQQPTQFVVVSQKQAPVATVHLRPAPQLAHASPPVPHLASVRAAVMQVLPSQQPLGHEVGLQTHAKPEHRWVAAHAAHVAPPAPHWLFVAPELQLKPPIEQQPAQPEAGSHTQLAVRPRPEQRRPGPHAGPDPQRQLPTFAETPQRLVCELVTQSLHTAP